MMTITKAFKVRDRHIQHIVDVVVLVINGIEVGHGHGWDDVNPQLLSDMKL